MKKKFNVSLFTCVLLAVAVVLVLFYFSYFAPMQEDVSAIKAETSMYQAQAKLCEPYLGDHAALEADIEKAEKEFQELRTTGYTNETNVSLIIGDAIQKYNVSLNAITLESSEQIDNYVAHPIHMTISGPVENVVKFIDFFEQNTDGSYVTRAVSMSVAGDKSSASIVLYMYTPMEAVVE